MRVGAGEGGALGALWRECSWGGKDGRVLGEEAVRPTLEEEGLQSLGQPRSLGLIPH